MAAIGKTTPNSPAAWRPDITEYLPDDVVPDALILQCATVAGKIEGDAPSVRVPFVADDGTPGFVAEGDLIADANQAFSEIVVTTNKVATLGKYSYETLQQPEAATLIVNSLSRAITRKANAAFLGNATDPKGLAKISGITDGGSLGDNLDTLVDVVTGIEAAAGTATHIIAAPDAWAALSKLKVGTDYEQPLLGAGVEAGQRSVLGVPVLVSADAPADTLIVLDQASVVASTSGIRVERSEHAFFANDVIGIKVTWRLGWAVMRKDRIAKLSTATTP